MFAIVCLFLGQRVLEHDSRYPWAVEALNFAQREGILVVNPDHPRRGIYSRYEYAVAFDAAIHTQKEAVETYLRQSQDVVQGASLVRCASLLPAYEHASKEFRFEFSNLGVNEEPSIARLFALHRQLEASISAIQRLFSDVPAAHWASKAVGDMRALGLLNGYPDGRLLTIVLPR